MTIELIDVSRAFSDKQFLTNYQAAFGHDPSEVTKTPLAAAAASAAVGLVVDYVAKELEKEAQLYEAQFTGEILATNFWASTSADKKWKPSYYGLRITRDIAQGSKRKTVFDFLCGFDYLADANLWVARPLSFETKGAKAKVVSNRWYAKALLFPWLLRSPNSRIKSTVEIELEGYFRDSDQLMKTVPMGVLTFKFDDYDLSTGSLLSVGDKSLTAKLAGPFNSAPLPVNAKREAVFGENRGIFIARARVTEADISNIKDRIEKASKFVSSKKEDLQKKVEENVP